ncbi:MAG: hypothetical protein ACREDO_01350 [Methyloceanibacter sp.]
MRPKAWLLALFLAALPSPALANVVFPALMLSGRLLAWWVVALSLLIEFLFVRAAFRLSPLNAALATLAANAVSAAIGLFLLPYIGMVTEPGISHTGLADLTGFETFGVASWLLAYLLGVGLNLAIELLVYRFGYRLKIDARAFWLILLANAITVGLTLASLDLIADPHYGEVSPGLLAK